MSTIFQKIVSGELPSYKLYEDEKVIVILDIFPVSFGHSLVIPKQASKNWLTMTCEDYIQLQKIAHKIGLALQNVLESPMIGQMIDGREIEHTHVHLIPLVADKKINETSISKPTDQEFKRLAVSIRKSLESIC